MKTWADVIEPRAKTFDLAARLNASVESDATACMWHATALREMARIADREAAERRRWIFGLCLFGLKITVSRDG